MKTFIYFLLITLNIGFCNAHIFHHSNIQSLEFEIYRNAKYAGTHLINFKWNKNGNVEVKNTIEFGIKKFGITLYKYQSKGTEIYNKSGKLVSFKSITDDNGKSKFCDIVLKKNKYKINGTKYNGFFEKLFLISSYWNHDILTVPIQVSGITCKIQDQKVRFLKEEKLTVLNQTFDTKVFDIRGKELKTQIWFDKKTNMIVHQELYKKGKWEYKLKGYDLNKGYELNK